MGDVVPEAADDPGSGEQSACHQHEPTLACLIPAGAFRDDLVDMARQAVAVIGLSAFGRLVALPVRGVVMPGMIMSGMVVAVAGIICRAAGIAVLLRAVIVAGNVTSVVMPAAAGLRVGRRVPGVCRQGGSGVAKAVDALLHGRGARLRLVEHERQRLGHHGKPDLVDARQALHRAANLRRAARAIHAADLPGEGLEAGFGAGRHGMSPSALATGHCFYKL